MSGLALTLGLLVILAAAVVIELVRRRRLKERHAAIWLAFGFAISIAMLIPELVTILARWLGFELPSNLVLVGGLVVLTFVALQLSVELGRLRDTVERLTTEIALIGIDGPPAIMSPVDSSMDPHDSRLSDDSGEEAES